MESLSVILDPNLWPNVCYTLLFSDRFNNNVNSSRYDLNGIVENVANFDPDLKELHLNYPRPFPSLNCPMFFIKRTSIEYICKLKSLVKVVFERNIHIGVSGFLDICFSCKNLKWISGIEIEKDLDAFTMKTRFFEMKERFCFHLYDVRNITMGSKMAIWLFAAPLKQRSTCVTGIPISSFDMEMMAKIYPEVTRLDLDFDGYKEFICYAPLFPTLKSANLKSTNSYSARVLLHFLRINGYSLSSLTLTDLPVASGVNLRTIFSSCMFLKTFNVQDSYIDCDGEPENYSYHHLHSFTWEVHVKSTHAYFARVLAAPNLQEFYLKMHKFDSRVTKLVGYLEKKQVLTKLVLYRIESLDNVDEVNDHLRKFHQAVANNFPGSASTEFRSGNDITFSFIRNQME